MRSFERGPVSRAYEVSSTMELSSGIEKAVSSKEREVAERGKKILIQTTMIAETHEQPFRGACFGRSDRER